MNVTSPKGVYIQVINLTRRPDRLARISGELGRAELDFETLVAVDGQTECHESEFFSRGEIGCWRSHIKAMRRQVEKGADYSLILEDDATLGLGVDERFLGHMVDIMLRHKVDLLQIGFIEHFYSPSIKAGLLEFLILLLRNRGTKDLSGTRFVLGDFRAGTHAYIINTRLADVISRTVLDPPLLPWDGFLESVARGQHGRGDIKIARLVKSSVSQVSRTSPKIKIDSDVSIR